MSSGQSILSVQWSQTRNSSEANIFPETYYYESVEYKKLKTNRRRITSTWLIGISKPPLQLPLIRGPLTHNKSAFLSEILSFSKKLATLYSKHSITSEGSHVDLAMDKLGKQWVNKRIMEQIKHLHENVPQKQYNSAQWFKNFDGYIQITNSECSDSYHKICITFGMQKEDFARMIEFFLNDVSVLFPNLFSGSIEQHVHNMRHIKECQTLCRTAQGFNKSFSTLPIISPRYIYTGRLINLRDVFIQMEKDCSVYVTCNRDFAQRVTKSVIYMNISTYISNLKIGDLLKIETGIKLRINKINDDILTCKVIISGLLYSYLKVQLPKRFNNFDNNITNEEIEDLNYLCSSHSPTITLPIVCINYKTYYESIIKQLKHLKYEKRLILVQITLKKFDEIYNSDKKFTKWLVKTFDGIVIKFYDRLPIKKRTLNLNNEEKNLFDIFYKLRKPIILSGFFAHCSSKELNPNIMVNPEIHKYIYFYTDKYLLLESEYDIIYRSALHEIMREHLISIKSYAQQEIKANKNINHCSTHNSNTFARSIVDLSYQLNASCIILLSKTGKMATKISHFRPICPIIVLLDNPKLAKFCSIYHNVCVAFYTQAHCKNLDLIIINLKKLLFAVWYGLVYGIISRNSNIICVYRKRRHFPFPNKILTFTADNEVLDKIYEKIIKNPS